MRISSISAYTVFDSRGNPTVECQVFLEDGSIGRGLVPSGASTGHLEALELRDGDPNRFGGKSVEQAIANIKQFISPALIGQDVFMQEDIDGLMIDLDGTANKSKLGANAILAVSLACVDAAARSNAESLYRYLHSGHKPLIPMPEIQIIGGGAHSAGRIDVQDFMVICHGAKTLMDAYQMTSDVYRVTGDILKRRGKLAGVADEGGYWPVFDSNEAVFEVLIEAIEKAGYVPGKDISLSLDIAAAEFFDGKNYHLALDHKELAPAAFYDLIAGWINKYPICSIEDPFAESDIEHWQKLTAEFGDRLQIIGDDLFVTNADRLTQGINGNWANSVLIKLNQIGTVTETIACIDRAHEAGWRAVVSARSGETEDAFIAHLAVATRAGQLKVGSFTRSERMAKWNELLRIQEDLAGNVPFAGFKVH
ncbi:MAG: phosphopyruvate hydratase [Saprospiraceae bacterium]|nr:phosphopyruvate hydratase [Saprospiraceae bacterium]